MSSRRQQQRNRHQETDNHSTRRHSTKSNVERHADSDSDDDDDDDQRRRYLTVRDHDDKVISRATVLLPRPTSARLSKRRRQERARSVPPPRKFHSPIPAALHVLTDVKRKGDKKKRKQKETETSHRSNNSSRTRDSNKEVESRKKQRRSSSRKDVSSSRDRCRKQSEKLTHTPTDSSRRRVASSARKDDRAVANKTSSSRSSSAKVSVRRSTKEKSTTAKRSRSAHTRSHSRGTRSKTTKKKVNVGRRSSTAAASSSRSSSSPSRSRPSSSSSSSSSTSTSKPALPSDSSDAAPRRRLAVWEREVDLVRRAFDFDSLQSRLDQHMEKMRKWNKEGNKEIEAAEAEAREKARQRQEEMEREQREEEERVREKERQEAEAAAAAAKAAVAHLRSGRLSKRPAPAGAPCAVTSSQSPSRKTHTNAVASASAASTVVPAPIPEAVLAAQRAATAPASSRHFDPITPDRLANEMFQLPTKWRIDWADPLCRLRLKLQSMPIPAEDAPFKSFELPYDQFGDMMNKIRAKDRRPKFKEIKNNILRISRQEWNEAMGVRKVSGRRSADDDDGVTYRCTCQGRDPAHAPAPGSKAAKADADKSFNCGENCQNKLMLIECTDENCNLVKSGHGDACGNRQITNHDWVKEIEPFKTDFKGWGLHCPTRDLKEGEFLLEYVGEIINETMCDERMTIERRRIQALNAAEMKRREQIRKAELDQIRRLAELRRKQEEEVALANPNLDGHSEAFRRKHARRKLELDETIERLTKEAETKKKNGRNKQQKQRRSSAAASNTSDDESEVECLEGDGPMSANFYFLTISQGIIIDAGQYGSIARFLNHSCNPNCSIKRWSVGNTTHIGVFAARPIPKGTELTIDYQYDRFGSGHRQACFCGEKNCARFIGGKKKEIEEEGGPSHNRVRTKKPKEPTRLHSDLADEVCAYCGDGGDMVMCDARICGRFCTRCYHPACLKMDASEIPTRWYCPYHSCDTCGNSKPRYYCYTCSESACEKCWNQSRRMKEMLNEGKTRDEITAVLQPDPSIPSRILENDTGLHFARIRRDLPMTQRNVVWCCCNTCQEDPLCLSTQARAEWYEQHRAVSMTAIETRRKEQPDFGGDKSIQQLYEAMQDPKYEPRFIWNYWQVLQKNGGYWTDGWKEAASNDEMRQNETEEEISDEEWIHRQIEALIAVEKEDDDDEEEEGEQQQQQEPEQLQQPSDETIAVSPRTASDASTAAISIPSAPSSAGVAPMDTSEDDFTSQRTAITPPTTPPRRNHSSKRRGTHTPRMLTPRTPHTPVRSPASLSSLTPQTTPSASPTSTKRASTSTGKRIQVRRSLLVESSSATKRASASARSNGTSRSSSGSRHGLRMTLKLAAVEAAAVGTIQPSRRKRRAADDVTETESSADCQSSDSERSDVQQPTPKRVRRATSKIVSP